MNKLTLFKILGTSEIYSIPHYQMKHNYVHTNGYLTRGSIDRGKFVSNMDLIYASISSSSRRGGEGVNRLDGDYVYISQ